MYNSRAKTKEFFLRKCNTDIETTKSTKNNGFTVIFLGNSYTLLTILTIVLSIVLSLSIQERRSLWDSERKDELY